MGVSPGKREPLKLRAGIDVPRLLGMNRYGNQAQIPDACFHTLENVRFVAGQVNERPGLQRATNQVTGPIEGIYEAGDIGAPVIVTPGGGLSAPGAYILALASAGHHIMVRFQWASPSITVLDVLPIYDGTTPYYQYTALLAGSDNKLYACGALSNPVNGKQTPIITLLDLSAMTSGAVYSLPNASPPADGTYNLFGIVEDPNSALAFFSGLMDVNNFGAVEQAGTAYRNGTSDDAVVFTTTPSAVLNTKPVFAAFNSTIYGFWGGDRGYRDTIRKRAGAGSWSSLTLPGVPFAGAVLYGPVRNPVVAFGKLFFVGGYLGIPSNKQQHAVFSITTGDVVTKEHILNSDLVGGAWAFSAGVIETFVFGGNLYYTYLETPAMNITRLGKYDNVTWTDVFWDGQIAGVSYTTGGSANSPTFFAPGDGNAYCIATESGTNQLWVLKSNGADLSVWSKLIRCDDQMGGAIWNFFNTGGAAVLH